MAEKKISLGTKGNGDPFVITQDIDGKTQNYLFFYDLNGKKGNLFPVDADGNKIAGGQPIWTDGQWLSANIKDTALTDDVLNGYNDQLKSQLIKTLKKISGAKTAGVKTKAAAKIPAWAEQPSVLPQAPSGQEPEANKEPNPSPSGDPSSQGNQNPVNTNFANPVGSITAVWQAITDPYTVITKQGVGGNKYDFAGDKLKGHLVYPQDLSGMQDTLQIECFSYKPPYAESFGFTKNSNKYQQFVENFGGGLKRRGALKERLGKIILPMPRDVRDSNAVTWQEDGLNNLSAAALGYVSQNAGTMLGAMAAGTIINGLTGIGGLGNLANKAMFYGSLLGASQNGTAQSVIAPAITSMLSGQLGVDISPETILSRVGGIVQNSNTELLFRGVQTRSFQFKYRMTARGPEEAQIIRSIIRYLKQWSSAKKIAKLASGAALAGDPSFFLGTPNVFRLRYVTNDLGFGGGQDIAGVNKFKTCALTQISTNYSPDGEWNAFEGGQPVSVEIEMRFAELEPIYNTDYQEGVTDDRAGGINPGLQSQFGVKEYEVGY